MRWCFLIGALCVLYVSSGKVYLEDKFLDDSWEKHWIQSEHPDKDFGKFVLSAGKLFLDEKEGMGLQTSQDAKFYGASRKFTPFNTDNKNLVVQFSVKHEQDIECGGGYVKLFDCKLDQKDMHGESPYLVMFGPDICGNNKKVHAILNYKGKNVLITEEVPIADDHYTHVYTFIIKPSDTFEIQIDGEIKVEGQLEDHWELLAPKKIKDPAQSKPEDWVDEEMMADPEDKKPEDWDQPQDIIDEEATRPDDWDDEMDGEWEKPTIQNPDYKGEWAPKQITNPAYKGEWEHPIIDNPDYVPVKDLYKRGEVCAIGIDLWQVKSGTIFDNVLVTDDVEYAKAALGNLKEVQEKEKEMYEVEKEKKKLEEEEAEKTAAADVQEETSEPPKEEETKHEEL